MSVCSYTDREMRPKEQNGREHKFVSKKEADKILKEHEKDIIAYTKIGEYRYFAFTEDLENADIYIIDPKGIDYLKKKHTDFEYFIVYVTCSDENAKVRAIFRGDKLDVFEKRLKAEKEQFKEFRENHNYDIMIENDGNKKELYQKIDFIFDNSITEKAL